MKRRYDVRDCETFVAVMGYFELMGKKWEKYDEVNCTMMQLKEGFKKWNDGALMQDAFPFLSAHEREHLLNGNFSEQEGGEDYD